MDIDWNPYSKEDFHKRYFNGISPILHIKVINSHFPNNIQMTKEATQSFSLIGEHPTVQISNSTHAYVIESENKLNENFEWIIKLNKSYLYSVNPLQIEIKSLGSNILGCGIRDEKRILHIPTAYELDLGLDITDKIKYDNSTATGNIKMDNKIFRISSIDDFHSASNPNLKILNLKLTNVNSNDDNLSGPRSVLALTNDFMESYKILNLRKTNKTVDPDIFTTCQGISKVTCNTQEYLNVLLLQRYLIVHTNTGVFYTFLPSEFTDFTRPTGDLPSKFHRINELQPTVAKLGFENIKLMATVNTITSNSTYVYTIFSTSPATGVKNRIIYSLENYYVKGLWRATTIDDILTTLAIQHKDPRTEFISAVRFNNQNVYFIGIPVDKPGYHQVYRNCAVVIHTTDIFDKTNDYSMEFNLPEDEYFYGMALHENNFDIFIYGTSIYHSNDGGYTFKLKSRLLQPSINNSSQQPEYFTEFKSSYQSSSVYFITNQLNVYYGNTSITRFLQLPWAHLDPNQLIKFMINEHGTLSILDYSLGSLDSNLDDQMNSLYPLNQIFFSGTIPTKSIIEYSNFNALEFDEPFPLVPILRNELDIWLYAYGKDSPFHDAYIGYIINLKDTNDRLLIYDVSNNKNMLRVIPKGSFTHESRVDPLEITIHAHHNLEFSSADYINFNSYVKPLVQESIVTLTLIGNEGGRVWTKGDINKSVIVNEGSFIIRKIRSNREAIAELIFPLSQWMDTKKGIPHKSIFTTWDIYDLRGTIVDDSLVYFKIKIYKLNGNIYQMEKQDFSIIKSRNVYSNNKSLLDFSTMEQSWALKMDDCHWNSLKMTNIPDIYYLDYNGELNITINVNSDSSNIKAANHYQSTSQFYMTFSNPNIISYTNNNYYGNSELALNLQIKDVGIKGMNILNVFPVHNSIFCKNELPIKYIFNQCPPTRIIVPDFELEDQDILHGSGDAYNKKVMTLPYNYRPPSYLGTDVPIEDTFYHAHPGKERIKNRFKVSKNSGKYKQCEGKSNRQECGCTNDQKRSMLIKNSDCIENVIKLYQTNNYQLKFFVKEYNKETIPLDIPFNITELNNRTDYCISDCGNEDKHTYDPNKDKIVWRYYIIQPNPGFSIETSIMCLVCFAFIIWILLTYIYYCIMKVKGW
ncbi:hypothetical protein H8356DRAFT_918507 [Neocallimastix lanati (nom. inval.)]|nr:hypothetical protein H8356DRAFT_918507 [Neocallimastix sp. JGI-2020a]